MLFKVSILVLACLFVVESVPVPYLEGGLGGVGPIASAPLQQLNGGLVSPVYPIGGAGIVSQAGLGGAIIPQAGYGGAIIPQAGYGGAIIPQTGLGGVYPQPVYSSIYPQQGIIG